MGTLLRDACLLAAITIAGVAPSSGHRPTLQKLTRSPLDLSLSPHNVNRTEAPRLPRLVVQHHGTSQVQKASGQLNDDDESTKSSSEDDKAEKASATQAWMTVAISAFAAGVAVIFTAKIGEAMASTSKRVPTEADKMEEELEEARKRAEELAQALKEHYEAARVQDAEQPAEMHEVPEETLDKLTNEELLGGMHFRSKYFQKSLDLTAEDLSQESAPLIAKGARIHERALEEAGAMRERVAEFAQKEATGFFLKMKAEVGSDLPEVQDLANADTNGLETMVEAQAQKQVAASIPAFGLIIAGSFAPAQLQGIQSNSTFNIMLNGFLFATAVGLHVASLRSRCKDKMVWIWLDGVIGVSLVLVLSNSAIRAQASAALQVLEDARSDNKPNTGNSVWDSYFKLKNSSPFLLKALFVYDSLTRSCLYSLNQIAGLLYMIWGGVGVYVSIANVVVDTQKCDAKGIVTFMHFVSFMYVLLFIWSLISLAIWFVILVSSSSAVSSAILKLAMHLDDAQDIGIPIFVTVVKSFVLRSSVDMIQVQKEAILQDVKRLEEEAKEHEAQIEKRRVALAELEVEEQSAVKDEDALIEKYTAQVHQTLEAAKPLVTLAAISKQSGFENSHAAMQALNEQAQAFAENVGQQAQDFHGQAMATMESVTEQANQLSAEAQKQLDQHGDLLTAAQEQAAIAAQRLQEESGPALAAAQEHAMAAAGDVQQQVGEHAPSAAAVVGGGQPAQGS